MTGSPWTEAHARRIPARLREPGTTPLPKIVRVGGEASQDAGQLLGRNVQKSIATWWGYEPGTPDRALVEWTVQAKKGTEVSASAEHARAGSVRGSVTLGR